MQKNIIRAIAVSVCVFLAVSAQALEVLRDAKGELIGLKAGGDARTAQSDPVLEADSFIEENKAILGIESVSAALMPRSPETDELGKTHIRYQQMHQGVPVLSGAVSVHLGADGKPYRLGTKLAGGLEALSASPKISPRQAVKQAIRAFQKDEKTRVVPDTGEPTLIIVTEKSFPELKGRAPRLAWEVSVTSRYEARFGGKYYLDAHKAGVIGRKDGKRELDRRVYNCSNYGLWSCPSEQFNANFNPPNGYWFGRREGRPVRGPNPATSYGVQPNGSNLYGEKEDTDILYSLFEEVHNYWSSPNTFARNGANLAGGAGDGSWCPSSRYCGYVFVDHLWTSACPDNATYYAAFGEFDFCTDSATKRDVLGHESFHAVVWFEFDPHGTEYVGEIGALEEGSADVFGEGFEKFATSSTDWHSDPTASWGGRNLANPPSIINPHTGLPYPDRFGSANFYCGTEDNGGVHRNSTVASKAAYLMSEGGSFNGCNITGIGFENVQQILYRAWTTYFERDTNFNEAVTHIQQACSDLFGSTNPEYCDSVTAALQATEMDQLGYCADPQGNQYHLPACAVPPVIPGDVDSVRPSMIVSTLFSPHEWVYSLASGWQNVTEVDVYLVLHEAERVEGTVMAPIAGTPIRLEVTEGGFLLPLWYSDNPGLYDIVVDGNLDGIFNSSTDRESSFEVRALTDGDGLCYSGERYDTSENCRNQPIDCACQPVNGAPRYCTSFANNGRFRCLTLQQIQWLKGHRIREAVEMAQGQ